MVGLLSHKTRSALLFIGALLIMAAIGSFYGLIEVYAHFDSMSFVYVGIVGLLMVLVAHDFNESND